MKIRDRFQDHISSLTGLQRFLYAAAFALLWSLLGLFTAVLSGSAKGFIEEWLRLQGFFCVGVGIWLNLIAAGRSLPQLLLQSTSQPGDSSTVTLHPRWSRWRIAVVLLVMVVGSTSLISLGFHGRGAVLVFMWLTCVLVCALAGGATWHALCILVHSHRLPKYPLKVFAYSPAKTKELHALARYFTTYGSIITVGYAFALIGTLLGNWTAEDEYLRSVQVFWPVIYVPLCLTVFIYPHLVLHEVVVHHKTELMTSCQSQMNELLLRREELNKEDVDRVNALADLFEKVGSTPNYVIDIGIASRTLVPVAINVGSLFVTKDFVTSLLGKYLAP